MTGLNVPTPEVLKNRGVPVQIHALAVDESGRPKVPYERIFNDQGEPVLETRWVQFTNAVLADLEHPTVGFGGAEGWETALRETPAAATNKTMALLFQLWVPGAVDSGGNPVPDARLAGNMLIDGESDTYATAIGGAYMISNGVSPERSLDFLRAGVKQSKDLRPAIDAQVAKLLEAGEAEAAAELADLAVATPTTPTDPERDTPSDNGSRLGSELDGALRSSGV